MAPRTADFLAAAERAGLTRDDDFNGAAQEGVGRHQLTQRRGCRRSAADAYLRPLADRRNLTIVTGARVTGLVFCGPRVVGVRWLRRGHPARINYAGAAEVAPNVTGVTRVNDFIRADAGTTP